MGIIITVLIDGQTLKKVMSKASFYMYTNYVLEITSTQKFGAFFMFMSPKISDHGYIYLYLCKLFHYRGVFTFALLKAGVSVHLPKT